MNPSSAAANLGERFSQLFELVPALDAISRDQVFRIRHDVYCRDLGWEPAHQDGRESDAFDSHAHHCLLRRRDGGEPVGCTRLIVADPEDPMAPLPFEDTCRDVLDRSIADPRSIPREAIGEVSRLAVVSGYRRRKGESDAAVSIGDSDFADHGSGDRFPFIPVSLYLGATAIARRVGVEHVFVLTEPRLARHFARIGFDIRAVGGAVEHRGLRVPSVLRVTKVIENLRPMIRPLYAVIERAVDDAFRDAAARPAG